MKLLFVLAFGLTATLFSERFLTAEETAEEVILEFSETLGDITDELKILNDKQVLIIELLSKISIIADQHRIRTWSHQLEFTTSND